MKSLLLAILVMAVYVLHQDFWNWRNTSLVGFLPVGLAYHAFYSLLCAAMMAILVKFAWPEHLEVEESQIAPGAREEGH